MQEKNTHHTTNWYHLLILILLVAVLGLSISQDNDAKEQKNTVQTSGSASLTLMADQAEIYLSVETIALNAKEAQLKNAELMNEVRIALKKSVSDEKNVQTITYNLNEEKEYNQKTHQFQSKGYRAAHQVKVMTKDLLLVGKLIDDAIAAGATQVDSISFTLSESKQKEVQQQLITQASADARAKAMMLASALGVTVEDPISISESGYESPLYYANYAAKSAVMETIDTQIQPREIKVSKTVIVAFEID